MLQIESKHRKMDYEICAVKMKSIQTGKGLGFTNSSNLKFFQQCHVADKKANNNLSLIK